MAKKSIPGSQVVSDARRYLGVKYVYGGTDPATGLDCSGLIYVVAHDLGITSVPRTSEEQFTWVTKTDTPGPGDLVFLVGAEIDPPPGHVGIVTSGDAQGGRFIDAPFTGAVVRYDTYSARGTGVNHVMGFGHMPGTTASASANSSLTGQGNSSLEQAAGGLAAGIAMAGALLFVVIAFGLIFVGFFFFTHRA